MHERKHLGVLDAFARGEPLHIAVAVTRRRTKRICVIDITFAHNAHGFKTAVRVRGKTRHLVAMIRMAYVSWRQGAWFSAVRVRGKTRHLVAMIHTPCVASIEVLADVSAFERRRR